MNPSAYTSTFLPLHRTHVSIYQTQLSIYQPMFDRLVSCICLLVFFVQLTYFSIPWSVCPMISRSVSLIHRSFSASPALHGRLRCLVDVNHCIEKHLVFHWYWWYCLPTAEAFIDTWFIDLLRDVILVLSLSGCSLNGKPGVYKFLVLFDSDELPRAGILAGFHPSW